MIAIVARVKLLNGNEYDIHREVPDIYSDPDQIWSRWTLGNDSCDCNKVDYLNKEYNLGLGEDKGYGDLDYPCGDTIKLVSLMVGGVKIKI